MANSLNKIMIIGRVGKDPDIRVTQGGMAVTNLTVATSEKFGKGADKKEKTEWFNVTLFDKVAQIVNNYVKKGNRIYIEGRIQTETWEKDGVKHYKTVVIGQNIILLESKPSLNGPAPEERECHAEQRANEPLDDQDLPF